MGPLLPFPRTALDSAGGFTAAKEGSAGNGGWAAGKRPGLVGQGGHPTRPISAAAAALRVRGNSPDTVDWYSSLDGPGNGPEEASDPGGGPRGAETAGGSFSSQEQLREPQKILLLKTHYRGQLGHGANSSGGLEGPNIEMCTGLAVGSAGDHPATTGQPQEPGEFPVTKLNYIKLFKRGARERGS